MRCRGTGHPRLLLTPHTLPVRARVGEPSTGESCVELVNAALTRYCEGKQLTPFSGFTTVTLLPPPLNGQADEARTQRRGAAQSPNSR